MSQNPVQVFMQFLRDRAKLWSKELHQEIGLKLVTIDGEFLRWMIADDKVEFCWDKLKEQLPSDACVIDIPDTGFILQAISQVAYTDRHHIIFGSKEWDIVPDGEVIPTFTPIFKRLELSEHVTGASK